MRNEILTNTMYRLVCKNKNVYVGTIDQVSEHFEDGVESFERMPTDRQPKNLQDFFKALDSYIAKNGYIFIEDYIDMFENSLNTVPNVE